MERKNYFNAINLVNEKYNLKENNINLFYLKILKKMTIKSNRRKKHLTTTSIGAYNTKKEINNNKKLLVTFTLILYNRK